MSRAYQGYTQANQSVLEEDEDDDDNPPNFFQSKGKQRGAEMSVLRSEDNSSDDEVPQSLMIEATSKRPTKSQKRSQKKSPLLPTHVSIPPRPSEIDSDGEDTPRGQDRQDDDDRPRRHVLELDPYNRALWKWVNVYNLDAFLQDVYYYYEGKGIYSIGLSRGLNLLTVGFVIGFSTFLLGCIDYSRIVPDKSLRLSDVVVKHCVARFSGFTWLFFLLFIAFYIWQIVTFALGIMRLVDMYNFFTYLLKIPDADISTISWSEVVRRIGAIRENNPRTAVSSKSAGSHNDTSTAKLDAHDVANRIMRQENYLIALFNKDLLDLRVPLPPSLKRIFDQGDGKGKLLTKALEWNLRFCLMEYLFDRQGRVRRVFLKSKHRAILIEGLKRRFIFMGILNAIFAPFIVLYLLMYSFFRYFEEYHKNPSSIFGGRRYTSFAQWKFREFNELPHFFTLRLHESYPYASDYIGQFPNDKLAITMRFVAFISGSFAAVLFLATVLDPDIFVHFEITPHRTVLFYLGVFGSILAVARGMIPEENRIFDPEMLMTEVILHTHYMPEEWKGQLHSKKVHQAFGELFQMKVLIFVEELLSVVLTPFVLWFSLPNCAPAIIDFFREFTVHVDGRGYVCSFAEFNFERHGNVKFGAPMKIADKRMLSNEGKMEKSFLHFKATNPDWNPSDPTGSVYLSRMADLHPAASATRRKQGDKAEVLADHAQEYDYALRRSQMLGRRRMHGSFLGTSMLAGPSASSIFVGGGMSMAQTAVLGDSQGSVAPPPVKRPNVSDTIVEEDLAADGGLVSGLGESYVDGGKKSRPDDTPEEDEGEGLEDRGVLGLLAQIYGKGEMALRK